MCARVCVCVKNHNERLGPYRGQKKESPVIQNYSSGGKERGEMKNTFSRICMFMLFVNAGNIWGYWQQNKEYQ